jgi:SAM-dependent methyltransferase
VATYDSSFYEAIGDDGVSSAGTVVPHLLDLVGPVGSAVDLGCGVGSWLSVLARNGVGDVTGVDGPYVPRDQLRIPEADFVAHDLREPLHLGRRFDLALSLEVAEHLPASRAASFVATLAAAAPVVLFSAAVPGQGGTGHINEQWPDYWAELFEHEGKVTVDALRPLVWEDPSVSSCIAQNLLLFADPALVAARPVLAEAAAATRRNQLALVHPRRYELAVDPERVPLRRALRTVPHAAAGALARRRGRRADVAH